MFTHTESKLTVGNVHVEHVIPHLNPHTIIVAEMAVAVVPGMHAPHYEQHHLLVTRGDKGTGGVGHHFAIVMAVLVNLHLTK